MASFLAHQFKYLVVYFFNTLLSVVLVRSFLLQDYVAIRVAFIVRTNAGLAHTELINALTWRSWNRDFKDITLIRCLFYIHLLVLLLFFLLKRCNGYYFKEL